ncbi:MAG: hypothetical protein K9G67_15365 [Bacteroidales bacterium]|nr:hypothetical protein [Bacteroidales bacterium]MCF8351502.1 hypothetical protein [Bacteroidales bacterium]MCF8377734.1 hypothetical protein [Bacteroidales bacterium]MCF8402080.1 hypothetical protein [Bacteroidales bacterium]
MEVNYEMRDKIFEIINNQMKANDPPEVNETFKRLKKIGYTDFVTKQLIGQCIAVELYNIMTRREPFDEERYIMHLKNLPEEPFDDEEAD